MKPIVFNFNDSLLNRKSEAIALKAGYLLGDEVCSAGNTEMELLMEEYTLHYSVSQKLDLLAKRFANDSKTLSGIMDMKKMQKASSKVKHKVPGHIVADKKAEKTVHDFWALVVKYQDEEMNAYGFEALRNLDDNVLQYYMMNTSSCETLGYEGITASNLMQRLLPDVQEDEEPEIFILSNEFFNEITSEFPLYNTGNKMVLNIQKTSLCKCLSLPDFTSLTTDELKRLRKHLQQSITSFRENINEWIDMCYFNDDVSDRISFFTTHVLPATSVLQQCIDEKESLAIFGKAKKDLDTIEVWMGEVPVHQLWDYYYNYEVVKDCTWQKIEKLKQEGAYSNQRWPIMVLKAPDSMLLLPEESDDEMPIEEIKASKKYIMID